MIDRPTNFEDKFAGKVQLDQYKGQEFELNDWKLEKVLDDIILVQYADTNDDGTEVKRGSIWVPINTVQYAWRIGKVILAGNKCSVVKEGDFVVFPNDKGLKLVEINGLKNVVFLNESRIFGVAVPK